MTDTIITLGGFEFRDLEVPDKINFGGDHKLVVHELVGGQRVIDAMGRNDTNIEWEGLITGPDAIDRALTLEGFRTSGQTVTLTWFSLSYNVVVETFVANTEKYYQVSYKIGCKTISSGLDPFGLFSLLGFDQSILSDFTLANNIAGSLGIPSITSSMSGLNTALGNVSTFNGATPQTIASVMGPLNGSLGSVNSQISTVASRLFGN